ncbi:MAG: Nif3-like dinuclear metal center hexameric protein [Acidimicrobiia bacterium]|nr:Nif3-like dinuclear metal center hexameric protein [Acidimicrobiia bacterium]
MSKLTVGDVVELIGRAAPWAKAAGWDPVGLQLGDPAGSASRIAVCHEVTETVVAAIEADPVDLLVTYHPLLFKPINRLVAGRSPVGRAYRLLRAGTSLAVAHTNYDAAPGGTADALAGVLGLEDTIGFGPLGSADSIKIVTMVPEADVDRVADAMARAGAGRIGNYRSCSYRTEGVGTFEPDSWAQPTTGEAGRLNKEAEIRLEMVAPRTAEAAVVAAVLEIHPYEEPAYDIFDRRGSDGMIGRVGRPPGGTTVRSFAQLVASALGGDLRLSWAGADFNLVGVVPGAGAEFIDAAAAAGVQALVTGDVNHHHARRAIDLGISIIDPGHARTERPGVAALFNLIAEAVSGTIDLTGIDPSPWEGIR